MRRPTHPDPEGQLRAQLALLPSQPGLRRGALDARMGAEGGVAIAELLIRDVTRAGRELGRSRLTDLPASLSLGELLETRIRTEVAAYNEQPGPVFVGLVQPEDSIRHSDGFRMRQARPLDPEGAVQAARAAVASGMLAFQLADERLTDLDHVVTVDEHDELLAVLDRPVVAALA